MKIQTLISRRIGKVRLPPSLLGPGLAVIGLMIAAFSAQAVQIDSTDVIGQVTPAKISMAASEVTTLLNYYDTGVAPVIPKTGYTLSGNSFGPSLPGVINASKVINEKKTSFTLNLGKGSLQQTYQYMLVLWGKVSVVYDISGLEGPLTVVNNGTVTNKKGVSLSAKRVVLFNGGVSQPVALPGTPAAVPDGGSTLVMLGAGLAALGLLSGGRRRERGVVNP